MVPVLRGLLDRLAKRFPGTAAGAAALDGPAWQALRARVPFISRLSPADSDLLRQRIPEFLARHRFVGIGIELRPWQRELISAYACLPILHLGSGAYRDWKTLLVYPDTFAPEHEWIDDETGVHHRAVVAQAGEAWERGPVVLSWGDVVEDAAVIVHEMAHTLDATNGELNGFPALPGNMSAAAWTEAFSAAYETLQREIETGEEPAIDPYAATDPAEFLAVACEYFFFAPGYLSETFPDVYTQLAAYFQQHPHLRGEEIPTAMPVGGAG